VAVFVVVEIGIVDVYVLHEDLARIDQRHRPHLALDKLDALDHGVGQTIEGDLVRPPRKVANCSIFIVPICVFALACLLPTRKTMDYFNDGCLPDLTISIKSTFASGAVHVHPITAEDEGSGMILIAHRQGILKPVRYIGTPEQSASDVNLNVRQTCDLHDRVDVVWKGFRQSMT
jgi:hypothetical protein